MWTEWSGGSADFLPCPRIGTYWAAGEENHLAGYDCQQILEHVRIRKERVNESSRRKKLDVWLGSLPNSDECACLSFGKLSDLTTVIDWKSKAISAVDFTFPLNQCKNAIIETFHVTVTVLNP